MVIGQWIGAAFVAMVVLGLLAQLSATVPLGAMEAGPAGAPSHASAPVGVTSAAAAIGGR